MMTKQIYASTVRARCYWKDTQTGLGGIYTEDKHGSLWDNDDGEGISTFMWSEGNYACDCNRLIFFLDRVEDIKCGGERFIIWKLEALDEDGKVIQVWDPFEEAIN